MTKHKKSLAGSTLIFSALVLTSLLAYGQQGPEKGTAGSERPLSEILNPDGTLKVGPGAQGSFDPKGFRMVTGQDGQPRFLPHGAGMQAEEGENLAAAGDENWDDRFGCPINGPVHAIAVSGTDVYVGGLFTDAGGVPEADRIVKWSGTGWSALGSGLNDIVFAIAVSGPDV